MQLTHLHSCSCRKNALRVELNNNAGKRNHAYKLRGNLDRRSSSVFSEERLFPFLIHLHYFYHLTYHYLDTIITLTQKQHCNILSSVDSFYSKTNSCKLTADVKITLATPAADSQPTGRKHFQNQVPLFTRHPDTLLPPFQPISAVSKPLRAISILSTCIAVACVCRWLQRRRKQHIQLQTFVISGKSPLVAI